MRECGVRKPLPHFLCALFLCVISAHPAFATDRALVNRVKHMEKELNRLKKDFDKSPTAGQPMNSAQVGVKLSEIEVDIRRLRGQLEELIHIQQKLNQRVSKLEKEYDARLGGLEGAMQDGPKVIPIGESAQKSEEKEERNVTSVSRFEPKPKSIKIGDVIKEAEIEEPEVKEEPKPEPKVEVKKEEPKPESKYGSAQEHYDAAFKALNQEKYKSAQDLFADFVSLYPKDDLVGNAYYWLGETYFITKNYGTSALNYRKGFQAMPDGPKASDNLLKLAKSLAEGKKTKEACVVLSQIKKKYQDSSQSVMRKVTHETARLKCK